MSLAPVGLQVLIVKRFSYVATLTFNGMLYTKGDVTMPTAISQLVEGTWREVGPDRFRPVCEAAALDKSRTAIQQFPSKVSSGSCAGGNSPA